MLSRIHAVIAMSPAVIQIPLSDKPTSFLAAILTGRKEIVSFPLLYG